MKQKTLDFLEAHKSEQPSTFTEFDTNKGWQEYQSCHPTQSYQANIYEQYVCQEHCQS